MPEFVKASWKVPYMKGSYITQTGYRSAHFGIHKNKLNRTHTQWAVTHLPSGTAISLFARETLQDAKDVCSAAEAAFNWAGSSLDAIASENNLSPRAFFDEVKSLAQHRRA